MGSTPQHQLNLCNAMQLLLLALAVVGVVSNSAYLVDDSWGLGRRFDGIGGISGGGATSKLLINYPEPQRNQVLDYLFKPGFAASLQILKVEIGGDSQSTDGVEASHMHSANDLDLNRGYEWWLMKEAKKRNPNIKLYGLPWVWPGWLGGGVFNPWSNRTNTLRYVMNWIVGAKQVHGLHIDYIGIWNERPYDTMYIKMLRQALDSSGHSDVQIVAADAEYQILSDFFADPELRKAIDIIGVHYPATQSPPGALKVDRPLWASEDYSTGNGLNGGGCWARVLNNIYVNGYLTSAIAWNLITSYMDNLPYTRSSLMTANQPWSGYYEISSPIWTTAHHTQFTSIGWRYLLHDFGVGNLTGNGSYVALTSPDHSQLTIIIETMDPNEATCLYPMPSYNVTTNQTTVFTLKGSYGNITSLNAWYSKIDYESGIANLFQQVQPIQVVDGKFSLDVERNSVYTLTTLSTGQKGSYGTPPPSQPWPLPYKDNFNDYMKGQEPYNLAQQAGSWEVMPTGEGGHGNAIKQMVPEPPVDTCLPVRMYRPVNVFGDFSWADIRLQMDVYIPSSADATTGVYIATRVTSGGCGASHASGLWFWVFLDKQMAMLTGDHERKNEIAHASLMLKPDTWYTMALQTQSNTTTAWLDGTVVFNVTLNEMPAKNGFLGFGTETFAAAFFDNLVASKPAKYM